MQTHHAATEAVKVSPPLTVAGLTLFGVSLSEWVLVLTLLYTALQIMFLLRDKLWRPYCERKRRTSVPAP